MAKRRLKPKMLLLSNNSQRSIARLAAALAYTAPEHVEMYRLRQRALAILEILREMT